MRSAQNLGQVVRTLTACNGVVKVGIKQFISPVEISPVARELLHLVYTLRSGWFVAEWRGFLPSRLQ